MTTAIGSVNADQALGLLLVYLRIQACVLALPVFSERVLPLRMRAGLAMVLTPLLHSGLPLQSAGGELILLAAAEVVTGLALGMLVRMFAMALDVAAMAISTTASLSQLVGGASEHSPHAIGNLMHLAGLALLMALGFPLAVCQLLRNSFELRPVGAWPAIQEMLPAAVGVVQQGFLLAHMLAAPFILGGFLFQALSGMVSKVMPALPVVFIAAPAAILLALLALALLSPSILGLWAQSVLDTMPEVVR